MATITVRKLDDSTVENLKARAKVNGRSMEEEARLILAREAGVRRFRGAEAVEHVRRFRETWFGDRVLPSSQEVLRDLREEDPTRWDGS